MMMIIILNNYHHNHTGKTTSNMDKLKQAKLKPGLGDFYAVCPANRSGIFYSFCSPQGVVSNVLKTVSSEIATKKDP